MNDSLMARPGERDRAPLLPQRKATFNRGGRQGGIWRDAGKSWMNLSAQAPAANNAKQSIVEKPNIRGECGRSAKLTGPSHGREAAPIRICRYRRSCSQAPHGVQLMDNAARIPAFARR
jgi:hypothetical protein